MAQSHLSEQEHLLAQAYGILEISALLDAFHQFRIEIEDLAVTSHLDPFFDELEEIIGCFEEQHISGYDEEVTPSGCSRVLSDLYERYK